MGTTSHDHRLAQHRKNGFSEEARPNRQEAYVEYRIA